MSTNEPKQQESAGHSRQRRLDGELVQADSSCGALTCTDPENQYVKPASAIYQAKLNPEPCANCWGDKTLGELRESEQSFALVRASNTVHDVKNADVGGAE